MMKRKLGRAGAKKRWQTMGMSATLSGTCLFYNLTLRKQQADARQGIIIISR
jgi:hypothetical protein